MTAYLLGHVLPVLAYGALCACLGVWAYTAYLNHWKR